MKHHIILHQDSNSSLKILASRCLKTKSNVSIQLYLMASGTSLNISTINVYRHSQQYVFLMTIFVYPVLSSTLSFWASSWLWLSDFLFVSYKALSKISSLHLRPKQLNLLLALPNNNHLNNNNYNNCSNNSHNHSRKRSRNLSRNYNLNHSNRFRLLLFSNRFCRSCSNHLFHNWLPYVPTAPTFPPRQRPVPNPLGFSDDSEAELRLQQQQLRVSILDQSVNIQTLRQEYNNLTERIQLLDQIVADSTSSGSFYAPSH
ncbi:hypothetical protein QOT17_021370 [Balamuthia mandrillaris]